MGHSSVSARVRPAVGIAGLSFCLGDAGVSAARKMKIGSLLVCLAAIMWGFDGVVLTPRLFNLNVDFVVFVIHALPFAAMNFILYREYRALRTLTAADAFYVFLIALFGGALGTLAIVKALFLMNFQHLTIVALLQKLQPIFAVLLARVVLGERFGVRFAAWAGVAVAAGYVLTFQFEPPVAVENGNQLAAAGYSLFAAFAFGSSTVFGKRVLGKLTFTGALFFRYGLTTLIMGAIVLANGGILEQFAKATPLNWTLFVIIGATTGSGAILLYYYGLRSIRASESTILELSFPIATVCFDYLFNDSVLAPVQWVAAIVMMYAVYSIGTSQEQTTGTPEDGAETLAAVPDGGEAR